MGYVACTLSRIDQTAVAITYMVIATVLGVNQAWLMLYCFSTARLVGGSTIMFKVSSGVCTVVSHVTVPPSRLLILDDDPTLLFVLSRTLETGLDHCTVDACETGVRALDLVTLHPYDAIISDVMMPGMNGWQFLRAVKQVRPDTPVFLMSGIADHGLMTEAVEAGAAGFFAKPFDPEKFVRTVRGCLNRRQIGHRSNFMQVPL